VAAASATPAPRPTKARNVHRKHPNVKREFGQAFIDWLVSPEGQRAIADYKINGEQLFYPNATDPDA
jgi:ABC-type tungstate transport system permease subunit